MPPFGRNKDFVGRQSHLNQLTTILHTEETREDCQRIALVGLGGVGKTQIALECAFQLQLISQTCSVFEQGIGTREGHEYRHPLVHLSTLPASNDTSFRISFLLSQSDDR